ncbi:uncharacterized protein [Pyrus communis]|uniref:uncharacterized protein n=1 Tax=Pyrus communis TaxID=23211 RepID=UPI0035BEC1C1
MTNLAKLDFVALDITGKNYLTWVVDTKIHLEAGNLEETIKEENSASSQDRAKTMIFIRRHLDEALKSKYLTDEDPLALWNAWRNRYNHKKTVILPGASEQNNKLLMKNHQSRSTGYAPFPEVNAASLEVNAASLEVNATFSDGEDRGTGKTKNHGVQFHNQFPRHNSGPSFKNVNCHKGKAYMNNASRNSEGACHRCDGNRHWARPCRTTKHLVNLYQASIKEKGVETNFLDQAKPMDIPDPVCDLLGQLNTTHLDVSDFIVEKENEVYWSD